MDILDVVYSEPTVSFHEYRLERMIIKYCNQNNIYYYHDEFGMLWLNVKTEKDIRQSKLLLVSHLDHPGIEIINSDTGKWLGGGQPNLENTLIKVFNEDKIGYGQILNMIYKNTYKVKVPSFAKAGCLWYKELPKGYQIKDNTIYTYAADDLIMVAALLEAVKYNKSYTVLLTRAEEFNLTGINKVLSNGKLDKNITKVIVLDTTHQTLDINIGSGIVLRFGDSEVLYNVWMTKKIEDELKRLNLKYIKHRLYWGITEASAFMEHNFKVGSIALSVENQHNRNYEGKSSPEKVSVDDFKELIQFLKQIDLK